MAPYQIWHWWNLHQQFPVFHKFCWPTFCTSVRLVLNTCRVVQVHTITSLTLNWDNMIWTEGDNKFPRVMNDCQVSNIRNCMHCLWSVIVVVGLYHKLFAIARPWQAARARQEISNCPAAAPTYANRCLAQSKSSNSRLGFGESLLMNQQMMSLHTDKGVIWPCKGATTSIRIGNDGADHGPSYCSRTPPQLTNRCQFGYIPCARRQWTPIWVYTAALSLIRKLLLKPYEGLNDDWNFSQSMWSLSKLVRAPRNGGRLYGIQELGFMDFGISGNRFRTGRLH